MNNTINLIARNPLDEDRGIEIKRISIDENTTLSDAFSQIRSDMDIYYLGRYYGDYDFSNACPYVITNGKVMWDVPFSEVSVQDFINTFDIDDRTIYVEVDCFATGGVTAGLFIIYKSWIAIVPVLDNIGRGCTVIAGIKFLKSLMTKRPGKAPTFDKMEKYVLSNDKWELSVLLNQTDYPEAVMKAVLDSLGYEEHNGIYYRNAWKAEVNKKKREELDYNKYLLEYTGFNANIPDYWAEPMATSLILLYEMSHNIDGDKTYNDIANRIESAVNQKGQDGNYEEELAIVDGEIERLERLVPVDYN